MPIPAAVGLRLASDHATVPRSTDPGFGDGLLGVVDATHPAALITTVAEEMAALDELTDSLATRGVATWLPPAAAVVLCLDKWKFARVLTDAGIATPATGLGGAAGIPGPWIVKPRFGRGSRATCTQSLTRRSSPGPVGAPRTRSCRPRSADGSSPPTSWSDHSGRMVGCVPRWRLETKAGISTKGETFHDAAVNAAVARTVDAVGLHGLLNLQGFVHGGTATVVEVNPRFSGGLPLSLAAGSDLVGEYLQGMLGAPVRVERLQARAGVRMTRYFAEMLRVLTCASSCPSAPVPRSSSWPRSSPRCETPATTCTRSPPASTTTRGSPTSSSRTWASPPTSAGRCPAPRRNGSVPSSSHAFDALAERPLDAVVLLGDTTPSPCSGSRPAATRSRWRTSKPASGRSTSGPSKR